MLLSYPVNRINGVNMSMINNVNISVPLIKDGTTSHCDAVAFKFSTHLPQRGFISKPLPAHIEMLKPLMNCSLYPMGRMITKLATRDGFNNTQLLRITNLKVAYPPPKFTSTADLYRATIFGLDEIHEPHGPIIALFC